MSDVSAGMSYGGPELLPEHRYFWRVKVWDKDGNAYPVSDAAWWETGLLDQANWKAKWIGYEDAERSAVRASGATRITNVGSSPEPAADTHHEFRLGFTLDKAVKSAVLYTTDEDTVAAWVNGAQVITAKALAPYKQMPWETYERTDVSVAVRQGANVVAIETTRYLVPGAKSVPTRAPMSMCLYVVSADGSTKMVSSAASGWQAALDAAGGGRT